MSRRRVPSSSAPPPYLSCLSRDSVIFGHVNRSSSSSSSSSSSTWAVHRHTSSPVRRQTDGSSQTSAAVAVVVVVVVAAPTSINNSHRCLPPPLARSLNVVTPTCGRLSRSSVNINATPPLARRPSFSHSSSHVSRQISAVSHKRILFISQRTYYVFPKLFFGFYNT